MFDRIEAGTYLIAAAVTKGNLKIKNVDPHIIKTELNILNKIGSKIILKKNSIQIIGNNKIKSTKIKTAPYPGFPTDLQAQIMVLMTKAQGISNIKEKIRLDQVNKQRKKEGRQEKGRRQEKVRRAEAIIEEGAWVLWQR